MLKETALPFQTRRPRLALTTRERREQVVGILSAALTSMPMAAPEPHVPDAKGSPESSQKALEVSRNSMLSVAGG
jgi:hypothetical protein